MNTFMLQALKYANKAFKKDEVPIGAVVVYNNKIIGAGYNKRLSKKDATSHAEIIAIRKACKRLGDFRLTDCDIYVTLEPCTMCMGAILNARIKNLYFGAYANSEGTKNMLTTAEINERAGLNHKTNITGGVLEPECKKLLQSYFKQKRKNT